MPPARGWLLPLLLLVAAPAALAATAYGLTVEYPVALVLFTGNETLPGLNNMSSIVFSYNAGYPGVNISFLFNVTIVYAPWRHVAELHSVMERLYRDYGTPSWARDYIEACDLNVSFRWLPLEPFYEQLHNITTRLLSVLGLSVRDTVVVIGDIDGVSRVYYSLGAQLWAGRVHAYPLAGVRGFAGWYPLTFYDLSTIPAPHPGYEMPFAGSGRVVSPETEPPIWRLSNATSYVLDLLRGHLEYHVAGSVTRGPWYASRVNVDIRLIVFDNATAGEILETLDPAWVQALLETLDPWIEFNVTLTAVDAYSTPFRSLRWSSENGWNVVVLEDLQPLLGLVDRGGCWGDSCRYVFYWLALPGRAHMTSRSYGINFTGISLGYTSIAVYPGYGYRVPRSGASRVVAHEVGHGLGLYHPFQLIRGDRLVSWWLMDQAYSVMSYCDQCIYVSLLPRLQFYDAQKLALLHSLVLLEKDNNSLTSRALQLLASGHLVEAADTLTGRSHVEAVRSAQQLYMEEIAMLVRRLAKPIRLLAKLLHLRAPS